MVTVKSSSPSSDCVILNGHGHLLSGAIAGLAVDGHPAEVVPAERDGNVHPRIVAGLGRAAVRRRDGGVEGEPALRPLVHSGDGVSAQCGASGVLSDRYVRLFPAEGDGYVFVVLDCDYCPRGASLEMGEAWVGVVQDYREVLGSSTVSLMMETLMSRVAWKRNRPPTFVRVKSPWLKLKLLFSLR